LPIESAVRPVVVVVVLPFAQLLVEQVDVVGTPSEQLIELFVVDAVRALDLAVQTRYVHDQVNVKWF
jgi:hypothetical protein